MKKQNRFVLSLGGLLAAAAGLYLIWRKKKTQSDDTPPKGAPQLKLDNPGDQSEFPAAPVGDRELG